MTRCGHRFTDLRFDGDPDDFRWEIVSCTRCGASWAYDYHPEVGNVEPGSVSIAVESDWPADGFGGCQGRNAAGVKCSLQYKHTGTEHRFCQRQPHDGYCVEGCFVRADDRLQNHLKEQRADMLDEWGRDGSPMCPEHQIPMRWGSLKDCPDGKPGCIVAHDGWRCPVCRRQVQ